jgi:hypothetical protein
MLGDVTMKVEQAEHTVDGDEGSVHIGDGFFLPLPLSSGLRRI